MTAPLFSAADLAEFQAMSESMMPHTAALARRVRVAKPGGGYEDTYPTIAGLEAVPCRLTPAAAPAEVVAAGRVADVNRLSIALAKSWLDVIPGALLTSVARAVVTHDLPNLPTPLTIDVDAPVVRSYEAHRTLVGLRV